MEPIVIVISLALVEYIVLGARVGSARGRSGLKAPAVVGNEDFERHFRVHYNTMEQLILFIPGIWFFGQYVHVLGAAGVGIVFLIGRAIYAVSYVKDPDTRSLGMFLTMIPCWILVIGGFGGAVWSMFSQG